MAGEILDPKSNLENSLDPDKSVGSLLFKIGDVNLSVEQAIGDTLHVECLESLPVGQVESVVRSAESGPCGGVKMTLIGMVGIMGAYSGPDKHISVNAPPTNGADSNEMFKGQGIQIGKRPEELDSEEDVYIISAHGNPRDLHAAEDKGVTVFDTTCPFVMRTHDEIRGVKKRIDQEKAVGEPIPSGIVYLSIDGKADHPERVGAKWLAEDLGLPFLEVEKPDQVLEVINEALKKSIKRLRVISQTTNNSEEALRLERSITKTAEEIDENLDVGKTFPFNVRDVCGTVRDRQNATREMVGSGEVDVLVIVGSVKSKNTKSLVHVALDEATQTIGSGKELAIKRIIMVNSWQQLPLDIEGRVGIVSGASTLDANINGVIARLGYDPEGISLVGESDSIRRQGSPFLPINRFKPAQQEIAHMIRSLSNEPWY